MACKSCARVPDTSRIVAVVGFARTDGGLTPSIHGPGGLQEAAEFPGAVEPDRLVTAADAAAADKDVGDGTTARHPGKSKAAF